MVLTPCLCLCLGDIHLATFRFSKKEGSDSPIKEASLDQTKGL